MSSPEFEPLKVLYICTHNRCRSALFESITNKNGFINGRQVVVAKSAGSAPAGEVHPLTLKYLSKFGYPTCNLTSNSWDDQVYMQGFEPDVLITVCDNAAGESCPIWLGTLPNMVKLHWGLADPSKVTPDEIQTQKNFEETISIIEKKVLDLINIAGSPLSERRQALLRIK